jgi:carboxymethylenebutenolidase
MNRLFAFVITALLCLAVSNDVIAQSCCKKPEGMQAFAMNASFKAAHLAPLPLNYSPEKGRMITFPVKGGPVGNAFYIPADEASDKVLLIFHEWWGLNDYIKREAESWYKILNGKVNIYAVDLFDGKVAKDPDAAGKLSSGLSAKRGEAITNGVIAAAGKDKHIATLGWCMGGSWSFTAAMFAGRQAVGCVMYYGFPEKDMKRIKSLNCDVLYIRGDQDKFIKESDVDEFANNIKAAGRNIQVHRYDASHAFANPSNPKYDANAANDAQQHAQDFLRQKLMVE